MQYEEMLASLVEFPTVAGTSNAALIDFIRHYLAKHGVAAQIIAGPEQDRFNLFATIGPADTPGFVLSGHLDVVPAGELGWRADPFKLRRENGCLIGRGAVDMKGYVAAVLSAVPQLVGMGLKQPLHIALSYDEEVGCRGVPYLIEKLPSLCASPLGCFVGEPSGMIPVLRHKGKATLALSAKGTSGHSSRPELGTNAIHALLPVLSRAAALPDELQRTGHRHDAFLPPHSTVQIGIVEGGQSVNTTDSAVRIVHIPTGLTVIQQDEKSQHKNKAKAMRVLRTRLYEAERDRLHQERAGARKSMVGSGDRSERIRTYNFPQGRVTDHRINLTLHRLPEILAGEMDELIGALIAQDEAERLASLDS